MRNNKSNFMRRLFGSKAAAPDMNDEMAFHIEMETQDLIASGVEPAEAARRARMTFGSVDRFQEEAWDNRRMRPLEMFARDIRFAARMLTRAPAFTAVAVLTLALGIGANTAIFSVVNAVLLKPLPYDNPKQLALVWRQKEGKTDDLPMSYPTYRNLRTRTRAFEDLGAWSAFNDATLTLSGCMQARTNDCVTGPETTLYGAATASVFNVLGVRMQRGQPFDSTGDGPDASARVAVISDRLWRERYDASPNIIGHGIILDGASYTVTGVLPKSFRFGGADASPDVWLPLGIDPASGGGPRSRLYAPRLSFLGVIGRLRDGKTPADGARDMSMIASQLRGSDSGDRPDLAMHTVPLREQIVRDRRATLLTLLAGVGIVLLISCANVANLLLIRATARARELAVRLALGASRRRLITQLLTESLLLSLVGAAFGLVIARWFLHIVRLVNLVPTTPYVPYRVGSGDVSIDGAVLAFTIIVSVAVGLVFGLIPALHATTGRAGLSLGAGVSTSDAGARRTRSALVVAEVALSVTLLLGAVLMTRSLLKLTHVDAGFDDRGVLTARVTPAKNQYSDPARLTVYYTELLRSLQSIPGVKAAGAVDGLPLAEPLGGSDFGIAGSEGPPPGEQWMARYATSTPGYFEAMRIPVRSGRTFTWSDDANSRRVVIINEALAKKYFGSQNPIGRRLGMSMEGLKFTDNGPPTIDMEQAYREIIGVVADVRTDAISKAADPMVYFPFLQHSARQMHIVLRSNVRASALEPALRVKLKEVAQSQSIDQMEPMTDIVNRSLGDDRFRAFLIGGFAALSIILAGIGLYGVLAYSVGKRTAEIGVRLALGAQRTTLVSLVLKDALVLAGTGALIGCLGSLVIGRVIGRFLYETPAVQSSWLFGSTMLMLAIAGVAAFVPALRATRISAVEALKSS